MSDRNIYKRALDFQDACNLSGVIKEMSCLTIEIWEEAREEGHGTDWVNNHPVMVMFRDKINHLCTAEINKAWDVCEEKS